MNDLSSSFLSSIHHDGSARYVRRSHNQEPRLGDGVTLRLRTAPGPEVQRVLLRTTPDGEQHYADLQPENAPPGAPCQWWQVQLSLQMPLTGYRFLLFTVDGPWWYNAAGLHRHLTTDAEDFRLLAGYEAPAWVRSAVFYQIFPDRFADGDPGNNVRPGEWSYGGTPTQPRRWGELPAMTGREAMVEFYGGDLQGVEQNLTYLHDLGVNAIYLNPIFTAFSNHRYDVADYFAVDPHLGGDAALASLRQATRARDMRLILDIVPNHCGWMHPWFQAAQRDLNAPSAEYFTFLKHPDQYACWLGVPTLPKFNYRSPALREVMYAGRDSVFRYWLRPPYSIDGWRLDVANMLARQGAEQLGEEIGRGIRLAVKAENPEAYVLGENFFDASSQLQGDMWDAVMNYSGFAKPLWYWLSRFFVRPHGWKDALIAPSPWPTRALVDSWQAFRASIPWAIATQQLNLLGSHDTPRILSVVGGDLGLARLAAGLLMTYVGVPCVYYGDEIGMTGEGQEARATMIWDPAQWQPGLRDFYRTLIHLRRTSPALIHGGFQLLAVEENSLAFLRDSDEEQLIVIGHRGPEQRPAGDLDVHPAALADGTQLEELFSGLRAVVSGGRLPVPAMPPGIQIWRTT